MSPLEQVIGAFTIAVAARLPDSLITWQGGRDGVVAVVRHLHPRDPRKLIANAYAFDAHLMAEHHAPRDYAILIASSVCDAIREQFASAPLA